MNASTAAVQQGISLVRKERFPKDEPKVRIPAMAAVERTGRHHQVVGAEPHRYANAGPDCYWEVSES